MDGVPLVVSGSGGVRISFTPVALFTMSPLAEKPVEGRAIIGVHCHVYIRYGAGPPGAVTQFAPKPAASECFISGRGYSLFFQSGQVRVCHDGSVAGNHRGRKCFRKLDAR